MKQIVNLMICLNYLDGFYDDDRFLIVGRAEMNEVLIGNVQRRILAGLNFFRLS